MRKNKIFRLLITNVFLATLTSALLTNVNLEKYYAYGDYVKEEDAFFAEKIDDPIGFIKAQKYVTPTDNKYTTQITRSLGYSLIGDIENVWSSYTGEGTTIAVIDDGFDYNHQEYVRSDGSSVILPASRYYYTSGNSLFYKDYATNPSSIGQDWDDYGYGYEWSTHGTATSTTAAAPMNNGGVVGIAPEADILALKIDMNFAAIKAAIEYAITQKVDVINMSLGAYAENFIDGFGDSQEGSSSTATYLNTVCQKAYDEGIIVVAAAGNEATYRKSYPASNSKVIGVGALGDYDNKGNANALAEFTNYVSSTQTGEINVDILAPGYVYTAHQAGTQTAPTHTYSDTQGTSFSSPIIAGAAALWKEKFPQGTPGDFLTQLQSSADGIGSYTSKMIPVSQWYSSLSDVGPSNITNGRLNVANLLDINNPYVTTVQSSFNISVGENRQITLENSNGVITYSSLDPSVATVTNSGLISGISPGATSITVTATKNGKSTSTSVGVTVNDIIATTSMAFNQSSVTLNIGESFDAEETLTLTPSNASRIFLFESNNNNVVLIDEDTGLVTAVGEGSTTIDAISVYGDGYAILSVIVNNPISQTGTINFGESTAGRVNVNSATFSSEDDLLNPWVITTSGTNSFTTNEAYSQIGSSKNPASSINFTLTLTSAVNFTDVSASFGGFSGSQANVTIKVGSTLIGTGNVSSLNDTTTRNQSTASGTTLTVSLTNISKGIKAYSITYSYTVGGGEIIPPTLNGISVENTKTYHPGDVILQSEISVKLNYSDGSSTSTSNFTFANEGYRFTYEDTNEGVATKTKQFSITYKGENYSFNVNVQRQSFITPSSSSTTLSSAQFSSSDVSKSSSTLSSSAVTIGGVAFNVTTNAYIYTTSGASYLSFGKNAGSIQNANQVANDFVSITVTQKSDARQDGVLTISKNASTWVNYSASEIAKGGYRYFKYDYLTTSSATGAGGYSNIVSISYTLSVQDNALNVAHYIMYEDTNNQCLTKLDLSLNKLNSMSPSEKSLFWDSEDYVIATARQRLEAWARHQGREVTFDEGIYQIRGASDFFDTSSNNQTAQNILFISLFSLFGLFTVGFYLYRKKSSKNKVSD